MERCYNPRAISYPNYGGRGITVCEEWRISLVQFCEDMGVRPDGLTLGRIDNNGPYSKENCRWETVAEQARNRRGNLFVEWGGERVLLVDLCKERGVDYTVVRGRLRMGWLLTDALNLPVRGKVRRVTVTVDK